MRKVGAVIMRDDDLAAEHLFEQRFYDPVAIGPVSVGEAHTGNKTCHESRDSKARKHRAPDLTLGVQGPRIRCDGNVSHTRTDPAFWGVTTAFRLRDPASIQPSAVGNVPWAAPDRF